MKKTKKIDKRRKSLLKEIPNSSENLLLNTSDFYRYCKVRFNNIGIMEDGFRWLINIYKKNRLLLPVYIFKEKSKVTDFYSTFQTYNLYLLEQIRSETLIPRFKQKDEYLVWNWKELLEANTEYLKDKIDKFNQFLLFLLEIQEYYLPEVRDNLRLGEMRSGTSLGLKSGIHFATIRRVLLSSIRRIRNEKILNKEFNPNQVLSNYHLSIKDIEKWMIEFIFLIQRIDPLYDWNLLVQYFNYSKKQKLRYDALLSQDFFEITKMLYLFILDTGNNVTDVEILNRIVIYDIENASLQSPWKERKYGNEALNKPYEMLEFLSNEYSINPKPRAIIFTEGEEWKAIKKLFEFYEYDPGLLGIEFRSIKGDGNFNLANWQCFIEYMHEKQILVFFILDNEGENLKQAKRLLKADRKFKFENLLKVIPKLNRIKIWDEGERNSSFEEANFLDSEIAKAINLQTCKSFKVKDIFQIRKDTSRKKGLIKEIQQRFTLTLDKIKLNDDLVKMLISKRETNPASKNLRSVEEFVLETGEIILLNHQPISKKIKEKNLETGELG